MGCYQVQATWPLLDPRCDMVNAIKALSLTIYIMHNNIMVQIEIHNMDMAFCTHSIIYKNHIFQLQVNAGITVLSQGTNHIIICKVRKLLFEKKYNDLIWNCYICFLIIDFTYLH